MDRLEESLSEIRLGNKVLSIKVKSLGKSAPECSLTKDGKKIIINKDNLFYKKAEKISFEALRLNCLKSMIVEIALTMADEDLEVFKETYDAFTRQEID